MNVAGAKGAARRWVDRVARGLPGFRGAFFHGSINGMADDELLPSSSDVDVGVVYAGPEPKLGKVWWDGVLVEGAAISLERLETPEQLLADYRLCPSFRTDGIIADPTGHLARVQREVGSRFAERRWVLARCEDAKSNCLRYSGWLDEAAAYPLQATCWLFAEGALSHVLLTAGMRNPTVRRRYSAVRELLASVGRTDVHERFLALLGCEAMPRARVEHHLLRMTEAFDGAVSVIRSDFPFGSSISEAARPVAVGGSRELVQCGEHREAVFWIGATYARCMAVLRADGTHRMAEELEPGLRDLMKDLGVETFEDMQRRAREVEAFLPELMGVAEALVSANPDGGS